jgi:hypothetical protein
MAERQNQNWEGRTIDSRGPSFRIDVANPQMGSDGSNVYMMYSVTDNKDVNLCALTQGGTYQIHNDKTLDITAGMTNNDGAVDIKISSVKGDICITANRNGQVKIKGSSIVIQADEDLDLIAGRNININGKNRVLIKANDISIDGIVGNLIENTTGSFIQKAVMGFDDIAEDSDVVFDPKVGLDWLVSKGLTTGLAAGSPVGIAGNVIGALL